MSVNLVGLSVKIPLEGISNGSITAVLAVTLMSTTTKKSFRVCCSYVKRYRYMKRTLYFYICLFLVSFTDTDKKYKIEEKHEIKQEELLKMK